MKPKPVWIKPPWNSVGLVIKSLGSVEERRSAYQMLRKLRALSSKQVGFKIPSGDVVRFLRMAANTWEGKPSKFDLTGTGIKIVEAWRAVNGGGSHARPRTLSEIKMQYARSVGQEPPKDRAKIPIWLADLEGRKKIPHDWTFRKTLEGSRLRYAKDKRGSIPN
jgi:hypothetical protein